MGALRCWGRWGGAYVYRTGQARVVLLSALEDDMALLEGVGAWGTQEKKNDDAFELFY